MSPSRSWERVNYFPLKYWPCILGIQLIAMFFLTITLRENGGTPYVVVRLEDIFVPIIVPQQVP